MTAILPSTLTNFPKGANELYRSIAGIIKEKADAEGLKACEVTLSQREIRERSGLSHMFVKRNIRTLVEYEYIRRTGSMKRGTSRAYGVYSDEAINFIDLSMIPTPEIMSRKLGKMETVKSGSEKGSSGA